MHAALVILAGVLIGASTGLRVRRALENASAAPAVVLFPELSLLAALVAGTALAELTVIVAVYQWPELAAFITGPLPALYGFVWFYDSLAFHRYLQSIQGKQDQVQPPGGEARAASPLMQIALGAQMGLLLCAVGARDLMSVVTSLVAAVIAATVKFSLTYRFNLPQTSSELARGVTGALLCALGAGTVIERMTEGAVPAVAVTVILAMALWTAAAIAFRRSLR